MAYLTFYHPYYQANHDENADTAYENLVNRFSYCGRNHVPAANIYETDTNFRIDLALPGVNKEDISMKHENGFLKVQINNKKEEDREKGRFEFEYSDASRTFKIGERVDTDNISAVYENGILKVTLPKKEAYVKKPAQEIAIQ